MSLDLRTPPAVCMLPDPFAPPAWTPDPPTAAGDYWYCDSGEAPRWVRVVMARNGRLVARFLDGHCPADHLPGDWAAV